MKPHYLDPAFWHNCSGLEPHDGGGWFLPRFPASVRRHLNASAQWRSLEPTGVELRFATEAPRVWVVVSALAEGGEVLVHRGDIHQQKIQIPPNQTVTIVLEPPPRFKALAPDAPVRRRYSPALWRIEFGRGVMKLRSLDVFGGEIRPPAAGETPARRWLAYGSSITHSSPAGYPAQAARLLGVDALNKGLGGACHAEREIAEYAVASERWDVATFELGVNMREIFAPDAFRERAETFLNAVADGRRDAPIGVITAFTNGAHYARDPQALPVRHQRAYDAILREWVAARKDPRIRLIEGTDLLDDFTLLSADFVHPTLEGQTRMAHRLAAVLNDLR